MPYVTKVAPDFNVTDNPGMCLALVEAAYNTPEPFDSMYGCARDSWDASGFKHETNEMPGVPVPVFFSWVGTINGVTKDWGDARIFVPGRGVFGSPLHWDDPAGNSWVADLNEIERLIPGAKYLGWTEDISGYRVVDYVEDVVPAPVEPVPAPEPAPVEPVKPDVKPENEEHEEKPVAPENKQDIEAEIAKQQALAAKIQPADLGSIITHPGARKAVWAVYGLLGIFIVGFMGGLTAIGAIAPEWFLFATGAYTAVGPAFASLAIANIKK